MSGKSIAIFTSTGDQGTSVTKALLADGWRVTGFTRDTSNPKAQALAKLGAEMVNADMLKPESYKNALKGKDAAFVNADFWTIYQSNGQDAEAAKDGEMKQAKDAIQAAVDAGVKHIVYSTLDGGINAVHWDSKAEVSQWARDNNYPVTHLYLTFYFSGIARFKMVKPQDDGSFVLGLPVPDEVKVPGMPVEQTGMWVKAVVNDPLKWIGKDIYACTDNLSISEMAETLSKVSGKKVSTNHMPGQYFLSDDFKGKIGNELWDQWKMFYDGNPKRDIPASKGLVEGAWDFEAWAKQDKSMKDVLGF